jgi:hypothetical protein
MRLAIVRLSIGLVYAPNETSDKTYGLLLLRIPLRRSPISTPSVLLRRRRSIPLLLGIPAVPRLPTISRLSTVTRLSSGRSVVPSLLLLRTAETSVWLVLVVLRETDSRSVEGMLGQWAVRSD